MLLVYQVYLYGFFSIHQYHKVINGYSEQLEQYRIEKAIYDVEKEAYDKLVADLIGPVLLPDPPIEPILPEIPDITFTGHSLGGGIASVMGVWFDEPAVVFDPAPFKNAVLNDGSFNAPSVKEAAIIATISGLSPEIGSILAGYVMFGDSSIKAAQDQVYELIANGEIHAMDSAFAAYNKDLLAERSSNVTATAIKGEILEKTLGVAV